MVSSKRLSEVAAMLAGVLPFPPGDLSAYVQTIRALLPQSATDDDLTEAFKAISATMDKFPVPAVLLDAVQRARSERESREASRKLVGLVPALDQFGREWMCRPEQVDAETGLFIGEGHDELGTAPRPSLPARRSVDAEGVLDRLAIRKAGS